MSAPDHTPTSLPRKKSTAIAARAHGGLGATSHSSATKSGTSTTGGTADSPLGLHKKPLLHHQPSTAPHTTTHHQRVVSVGKHHDGSANTMHTRTTPPTTTPPPEVEEEVTLPTLSASASSAPDTKPATAGVQIGDPSIDEVVQELFPTLPPTTVVDEKKNDSATPPLPVQEDVTPILVDSTQLLELEGEIATATSSATKITTPTSSKDVTAAAAQSGPSSSAAATAATSLSLDIYDEPAPAPSGADGTGPNAKSGGVRPSSSQARQTPSANRSRPSSSKNHSFLNPTDSLNLNTNAEEAPKSDDHIVRIPPSPANGDHTDEADTNEVVPISPTASVKSKSKTSSSGPNKDAGKAASADVSTTPPTVEGRPTNEGGQDAKKKDEKKPLAPSTPARAPTTSGTDSTSKATPKPKPEERKPITMSGAVILPLRHPMAKKYELSFTRQKDLFDPEEDSDIELNEMRTFRDSTAEDEKEHDTTPTTTKENLSSSSNLRPEGQTEPLKKSKETGDGEGGAKATDKTSDATKPMKSSGGASSASSGESGPSTTPAATEAKKPNIISRLRTRAIKYLSRLDQYEENSLVKKLDGVGDDYDPSEFPKNVYGAFSTTIVRAIFIFLIAYNTYLLASGTTSLRLGDKMVFNGNFDPANFGLSTAGKSHLDVPTLTFNFDHQLIFYEVNGPSLQRIELDDATGYNAPLQSNNQTIPIATAFVVDQTVDLNSFDTLVQDNLNPVSDGIKNNMKDEQFSFSTHSFKESLKVLYKEYQVYPEITQWYDHKVYLYVRLDPSQMADLKMCQLQISMYPKGVFDALNQTDVISRGSYQNSALWPGLVLSDWTWMPRYWDGINSTGSPWTLSYPERSLLRMVSGMNYSQISSFATSQAWGPDQANISSITSLSFNYVADGIFIDDFLNWEMAVSYITNMNHTFENITCDGDSSTYNLLQYEVIGVINDTDTTAFLKGRVTFPDHEPPFNLLFSSAIDQEEVIVTAFQYVGNDTQLTIVRNTDNPPYHGVDFHWTGPTPITCDRNTLPQSSAETNWTCDPANYWGNDGCHCDCGAYDPDCCLTASAKTYNCRNYEVCAPSGNCVSQYIGTANMIMASEPCDSINYAGESTLAGFTGADSDFYGAGGGFCTPCAADPYFGGAPQLDSTLNQFVCNIISTGNLIGRDNYPIDETGNTSSTYRVHVSSSLFPTVGFPYPVLISDKEGIEETLNVINITTESTRYQKLTVQTKQGESAQLQHFSFGKLISAFSADSSLLVLIPSPNEPNSGTHWFSTDGPYSIRVLDFGVTVIDASDPGVLPFQVLRLQDAPTINYGAITRLQRDVQVGDTVIFVEPFTWYWTSMVDVIENRGLYPAKIPIIIRGTPDTYDGIETADVASWDVPTWLCDPSGYHAGDGCDCNCGMVDPDCLVPTPAAYSGIVMDSSAACFLDPTACQVCTYCSYPGATCTTIAPTNTTLAVNLIQEESTVYYQRLVLTKEAKLGHSAGQYVETPVNGTTDPDYDWYSNTDVYDMFTFSSIRMLVSDDELPYPPSDRISPHFPEASKTPDPLQMQTALFIIPNRPTFNESDLCPTDASTDELSPVFDTNGWQDWTVRDDRGMSVPNCKQRFLNREPYASWFIPTSAQLAQSTRQTNCPHVYDLPKNQYNTYCTAEMPPSYELNYTLQLPFNNKWQYGSVDDPLASQQPEYLHDIQATFHFGHDDTFLNVESKFADNANNNGDLERDGTERIFYGQLDMFGPGLNPNVQHIPANPPFLFQVFSLKVDLAHTIADIQALQPTGWPTDADGITSLVNQFPVPVFEFPLDAVGGDTDSQSVSLEPGLAYFLQANLDIQAKYKVDLIGREHLTGWITTVTSTSAVKRKLDYFERNECHVRASVIIRDTSVYLIETYNFTLIDWFIGFGAALGYLGLAVTITGFLQGQTGWASRAKARKALKEHEKRVKDRAQLVELIGQISQNEWNKLAANQQGMPPSQLNGNGLFSPNNGPLATNEVISIQPQELSGDQPTSTNTLKSRRITSPNTNVTTPNDPILSPSRSGYQPNTQIFLPGQID